MNPGSAGQFDIERLFSVAGKLALVTGGSSGLGLMMAKGLLQNGARVIIASRKQEKCDMALSELEQYGECSAMVADVTNTEQRHALVAQVQEQAGGLSILINNAGANWGATLEDYPDAGFAKVIDTNLNAVFSLTRDLIPALTTAATEQDPARVINIGSMDGLQVPIVQRVPTFAYSASKAALHHLTRTLAVDLAAKHITVNAVAPGFFESRMTDYVFAHFLKDIEDDCPLHRVGQPEEIVGIMIYLVSRAGAYTNGTVIPVDGGTSISKGKRDWTE
ncbi:MAG: SDR family oxidoreductase [Gammaproteobacteria bacterium]|jgi:NAD(P)-dependent dehydrogenase (short-subunit alcohol dehydrogenase family)|nr:3-oxoacyl-ACP reductase [Gammaproteobacteria bacterium]MDP6096708.1 SDR family oxidoreductase [Gammaproteobacteria bacterium]MDP7455020.1 SDR family oxidoreductase [Gammaproteobacteria bacterium]HJO12300.1 SDR family oxidoreductase [Gammaproteobacteria bacterium]|tara:strand:+ start:2100 stop:2930 length:831 start_codon:yes stop_codon:yes gene_type:complete